MNDAPHPLSAVRWPAHRWRARLRRAGTLVVAMLGLLMWSRPTVLSAQISPGPLARAHKSLEGATQCVQCHSLTRGAAMGTACLSCHKDVKALIDAKRGYHAKLPAAERMNCASCHPDHAGEDFAMVSWPTGGKNRFDHRQAGWALEGKHTEAKCESCHKAAFRAPAMAALSKRKTGTPWVGLETACASCHQREDIHEGALKGGCQECHNAKAWAPAPAFNHDDARYPLTGKHADVKCDGCHRANRLPLKRDSVGKTIPLFRPITFAKCNDCHADPHKGRIKESCSSCHETTRWEAVDKKGFNHDATRYPLAGRHARVSCVACHGKSNDRPTPAFTSCASCHADVHRGEAGRTRDCASCHKVAGFSPASFTIADHARTPYPLEGKHATTKCAACHTTSRPPVGTASTAPASAMVPATSYVRLSMPSTTCTSCHADDHAGQPAVRNATGGCTACHTVNGFKPSSITVASHATFKLPLEGAHATAVCAACHASDRRGLPAITIPTGRAKFAFTIGETSCASCHADPHAGRYITGGARAAMTCTSCHQTARFRPSTVTTSTHSTLGYPLEGAHRAVPCADCHKELTAAVGRGSLRLSAVAMPALPFAQSRGASCTGCHAESHGTQFAARRDRGACESCHTVARFAGAEKFDHEKGTRFPLAGAHSAVPCAKCHVPTTAPAGSAAASAPESARRQYAGVSRACESCHTSKSGRVQ